MPLLGNIFTRTQSRSSQLPGSDLSLVLNEGIQWADSSLLNHLTSEPSLIGAPLTREEKDRGTCGNPLCSSGWVAPWKNRERPIFEGKWVCGGRCLSALVHAAVTREAGDGRRDGMPVQHRHRVPLGLIMLAQGWITHPQLQKALEIQRTNGFGRIGDWLVSECGLEIECVTRGLSVQWSCPVLTTDGFLPQAMALAVPRLFVEEYGILPLRIAGRKTLYVGFQDHLDAMSAFAVEQMNGIKTESGVITASRFQEAKTRLLQSRFPDISEDVVGDTESLASAIAGLVETKQPVASRLVRMHQYFWLRLWSDGRRQQRDGAASFQPTTPNDFVFTLGTKQGITPPQLT